MFIYKFLLAKFINCLFINYLDKQVYENIDFVVLIKVIYIEYIRFNGNFCSLIYFHYDTILWDSFIK
jgi:hypothetical protein